MNLKKNMTKFDMKLCPQYTNIPKEITSINQVHKKPMWSTPYSSSYFLKLKNGQLDLTYEFN